MTLVRNSLAVVVTVVVSVVKRWVHYVVPLESR